MQAIGSRKAPITPATSSHLYNTVCSSKLTYGMEVMDLPDAAMRELEKFHASSAKKLQRLPDETSNLGALETMGWQSMQATIDVKILIFLWSLMSMPISCIYKTVLICRYTTLIVTNPPKQYGPLVKMLNIARKYDLLHTVRESLETGEYLSKYDWKRLVKSQVSKRERKLWHIKSRMFSSLSMLKNVYSMNQLCWWTYVQSYPNEMHKCINIIKLLLGVHKLNTVLVKQRNITSPMCNLCQSYESETVSHFMFRCSNSEKERTKLWNEIQLSCPSTILMESINAMSDDTKSAFLLTGLNDSYVPEWSIFFHAIANFINKMYVTRLSFNN